MKILGIETSCDETSAAVVENGTTILSNIVASSKELHEKTGGIIPEIAAREQMKCILPVITQALEQSKQPIGSIDAIAVTVGPGLIGSLLVGVETAKTLSMVTGKPIIPVNHIFAHIYANFLRSQKLEVPPSSRLRRASKSQKYSAIRFPSLALVVSGGHTELFLMEDHGKLRWLGGTMDDAAGEAFDKTARMIGLGYGGGAAIAAEAAKSKVESPAFVKTMAGKQKSKVHLPRPMMHDETLNFSFSGLKTAVMREIEALEKEQQWNEVARQGMAWEIQEAITDVLVKKTVKAAEQYNVSSILLGGGVAANQRLGEKMESRIKNSAFAKVFDPEASDRRASAGKQELGITLHIPDPYLCTDNAAVIASYAYFNQHPVSWIDIQADPGLVVEVA